MLVVDRITVRYDGIPALRDASLEVAEGEFIGLIGPNGAGKSTTLKAIVGTVRDISGSIRFKDHDILGQNPEDIVRLGIALVPEGRRIFGTMTVGENLSLAVLASGRRPDRAAMHPIIERFPILGRTWGTSASLLSGGEQQQLAIARALLCKPELLLLDEPSLGLAPRLADEVFATLNELRDEGVTVLLVEQKASQTVELADRCYALRAGEIVLAGTKQELAGSAALAQAYLGG